MSHYHVPVLLQPSVEALVTDPNGIYADLTFGGGGHSRAIIDKLAKGRLFAFDQDADAAEQATAIQWEGFTFIKANFRFAKRYLKLYGVTALDGILADLGVSSHQFDQAARGFSIRFDAPLDMRMDREQPTTAADIIATYDVAALQQMLGRYGEITNAKTLAEGIVAARARKPIRTIFDLLAVLEKFAPRFKEYKYYAQVFQALRIEVNDEMGALRDMLQQAAELLKPGGRLVVLSYHSLEDRLVKSFINKGKFEGEVEKDIYGNDIKPFKALFRQAIEPSEEEIQHNKRARSAKMRVAVKL
ncbi:MAG: 16S rRNA (cytosine(1402)-N(4))-methyltransferase RsmH [Cytophagales bacterium]|nr:16S rRNA (cytosine(1402)-N(4))-methyltransferase RsmH [Bernardetiaceae bacterium]MDW8205760.1 16S rRNA (cytosine(1402)-N(4))-methyltransferase RsmH [Cytophagales bacterium]